MIGVFNMNALDFDLFERERVFQRQLGREPYDNPFVSLNPQKPIPDGVKGVILSDQFIPQVDSINIKLKIAHLEEPYCLTPNLLSYVLQNIHKFDLVFTHHKEFVGLNEKIKFYPFGSVSLKAEDFGIPSKSKHCSIIASEKNFLHGHILRHQVVKRLAPSSYTIKQGEPREYKLKYINYVELKN